MRVIFGAILLFATLTSVAGSPVPYVENKNQWPSDFRFGAEFPQMKVMLKDASIFFVQHTFTPNDKKSKKKHRFGPVKESHVHSPGDMSYATFELVFLDALSPTISASEKQKTIYNYFHGNDPSKWTSAAKSYGEIKYAGMYKGIDLKVYSMGNSMKYDWIVSPCADVKKIRFTYKGIQSIDLLDENLVVESKLGEVVETKPYAYQVVNGKRHTVRSAFEIDDDVVTFVFPDGYDTNYELVIDPSLVFSSYSGSTLDNWGNTATPDSKGNLYSGGMVDGSAIVLGKSFPTTAGAFQTQHQGGDIWDIGILKYDSAGANLLYVTYLGGTGAETPQSLVVNPDNELLILGATSSTDFPGTSGGFNGGESVDPLGDVFYSGGTDVFIAKLSEDGSQLHSATYLGGTANDGINFVEGNVLAGNITESPLARNYGDQLRGDILTDAAGNVYIATNTRSADFPVVNADPTALYHGGTHDAVVAKLKPDLSLEWSRLIGGDQTDAAYSVKLSSSGNVLVAGGTTSANIDGINGVMATAPGGTDGWIMILSPDGDEIMDGTYVGTDKYDQVYFIDIATNDDVLAYGQTQGAYPITAGVYSNPNSGQFLHRFKPDLAGTVYSTTFGKGNRSPDISPTAFLVNDCDNIYMAGWGGEINGREFWDGLTNFIGGNTFNLPVTPDAWQTTTLGNDFYMIVLTGDAKELAYATYLGGAASLTHVDGGTSRFDKGGYVYHAVCAGCGGRPNDFPSYNVPESRSKNRSANCNNAAFKFDLSTLRAGMQTDGLVTRICLPDSVVFENTGIGGEIFEWKFGDGKSLTVVSKDPIRHYYDKPGTYSVQLKAIDHSTCIGEDSVSLNVEVYLADMHAGPDQDICHGTSTRLAVTGDVAFYSWKTADGTFNSAEASPLVSPEDSTNYYVTMINPEGCLRRDTVAINVIPSIDLKFDYQKIYDCETRPYVKVQNVSELKDGEGATFLFGDGTTTDETEAVHTYEEDGDYTITLRATKEFCVYQVSEDLRFVTVKVPNVITPGEEDGLNDVFKVQYGDPLWPKNDVVIRLKIMNRWGITVFESKDYNDDWKGADIDAGIYYYEVELVGEMKCKGWIHLIK